MDIEEYTKLSIAQRRFVVLYDQMFDARNVSEENQFAIQINLAANEVWELLTGNKDMPMYIEYCLPAWHVHHVDYTG